jgi:polysaccharide pyruvyl transferase WcaK-like protein
MDENVPDWVKRDHSYTAENVKQVGEALSRAVDRLSANAQIVVLPMHPRADQDEAMLKVMQQFMSRPEQAKLLPRGLGARATIELLGRAELVISSRLGSTVFALGQATPTVALAYESRQLEVMQRAGQPDCAIDWKQLEGNRFVSICENAWQMRAPMRKQLQFHAAASSRQVQMDAALLLTPFLFNEPLESATASV